MQGVVKGIARQDGAMDLKPGSTDKVDVGCWEGLPDKGKQGELGLSGMVVPGVLGNLSVQCGVLVGSG